MKKHRRLLITCAILAVLVPAVVFLLRWAYTCLLQKMYPCAYSTVVAQEAAVNGLDPYLVYAVIRQESRFNPDATSGAGAVGLMQLTPSTFEWLQKKESGSAALTRDSLYQPEVNVKYGCRLLSLLMKKYGTLHTALCAYNAGQGRVDAWLKDSSVSKDGKTLDSVPYPETRDYARKVEANYAQYKALYAR